MAPHTTPSSLHSPPEGDDGRQLVKTTGGKPMYTSTPTHANTSIEHGRNFPDALSAILKVAIHTKASLKTEGLDAALVTIQEKLSSPDVNAQVEMLTSSESDDQKDEIASKLAAMLSDGNANVTDGLKAYDLDLQKVIKVAAETVEKSPEFSRFLRKTPSIASAESDSPDRLRQVSQRRHRSLSSSGKSDFFQDGRVEPLTIDVVKHLREQLKAATIEKEEFKQKFQVALTEKTNAELKLVERTAGWEKGAAGWEEIKAGWEERKVAWAEEKASWAKTERRLEQYADGYKQDKEKWENIYAEAKAEHKEEKDRLDSQLMEWNQRHAEEKAERGKQERRHQLEMRETRNLHDKEMKRREALEEELKALRARLYPSA
ncbi:hypothetical protein EYR40_005801 [Pleurotus pulmonarius]|nr:hypothetical protein EYR36_005810 [Pleurotus pulmonarius]KAF4602586.1 hypothetical protein EYR40_005801 [Pleurotus pulmonarius]